MTARSLWLDRLGCRWPLGRLKDHVSLSNGFPFDSQSFSHSRGTRLVRIRDLTDGSEATYVDAAVPAAAIIDSGDLIVGMDGDFSTVTWDSGPAALNQRLCVLRSRPTLDQRFLGYLLPIPLKAINDVTYFTTVKHLSSFDLLDERIPLPPVGTQMAIANFLDRETARIDALIVAKRQMTTLARERLEVAISSATIAKSALASPNFPLPPGWKLMPLKRCLDSAIYGIGDAVHSKGDCAVLGMGNIDSGAVVGRPGGFVTGVQASLLLRPGDLLFNRTNSRELVGKVGLVRLLKGPTTFASYLVRLRTNELVEPEYLNLLLNTPEILGLARSLALPSIGQANLNPNRYSSIVLPIPPREEQGQIASAMSALATEFTTLKRTLGRQVDLFRERRRALITAAVTGHLDIPGSA